MSSHVEAIWKLFVKSWRDMQGQNPAVLRIWKSHPGAISSPKPRPQCTRVTHWVLGHARRVLCSLCAISIDSKEVFGADHLTNVQSNQNASIEIYSRWKTVLILHS